MDGRPHQTARHWKTYMAGHRRSRKSRHKLGPAANGGSRRELLELADVAAPGALCVHHQFTPMSGAQEITAANAGMRQGLALKSRVGWSPQPGVADFRR